LLVLVIKQLQLSGGIISGNLTTQNALNFFHQLRNVQSSVKPKVKAKRVKY
jgi:hypothetical protein